MNHSEFSQLDAFGTAELARLAKVLAIFRGAGLLIMLSGIVCWVDPGGIVHTVLPKLDPAMVFAIIVLGAVFLFLVPPIMEKLLRGTLEKRPLLKKRAEQGEAPAQASTGYIYEMGWNGKRDWEEAYFWYSLAAKSNYGKSLDWRDKAAKHLTSEQKTAVEKRIAEWKPAPAPNSS